LIEPGQRASHPGQEQDSKFLMDLLSSDFQALDDHRQTKLKEDIYVKLKT
jgi:hypothetical protein